MQKMLAVAVLMGSLAVPGCAEPGQLGLVATPPFTEAVATEFAVGVPYVFGVSLFRYDQECEPGCGVDGSDADDGDIHGTVGGYAVPDDFFLHEVSCDGCDLELPRNADEIATWRWTWLGNLDDSVMPVRVIPTRAGEFTVRFRGRTLDGEPVEGSTTATASEPVTLAVLHSKAHDPGLIGDFLVGASARWCLSVHGANDEPLRIPSDHAEWIWGGAPAFAERALDGTCVVFDALEAGTSTLTVRAAGLERELTISAISAAELETVELYSAAPDGQDQLGSWYTEHPIDVSPLVGTMPLGAKFLVGPDDAFVAVGRTAAGRAAFIDMDSLSIAGAGDIESVVYDERAALAFRLAAPGEAPRGCLVVGIYFVHAEFPYAVRYSGLLPAPEFCPSFGSEPLP